MCLTLKCRLVVCHIVFSGVNRETMIMLGAVSHIPEKSREAAKVVKRHFPGRLNLRCVRPLMLKNAVSESISPPHAQLYGVPR